jgi:hypothetical protein
MIDTHLSSRAGIITGPTGVTVPSKSVSSHLYS